MPPVVAEALAVHIGLMADGPAACDSATVKPTGEEQTIWDSSRAFRRRS